jgi:dolichyl-phosphate beta-glucosyltransferase
MKETQISVVVPCFNEGKTIYQNLKKINEYLSARFKSFEIIAVNDGSRDNTSEELQRAKKDFAVHVVDNKENAGKGKAVKDGVLVSAHEIVMFLDADLGIPIDQLEKFIPEIKNGSDLVIASRFVPGLVVKRPVLWYRSIMEKVFRILRMIIINNYSVQDTQCGFKVFKREVAMNIFPLTKVKRFAFDAEIIYISKKFGYRIKELPIVLQNPTTSSIRIVRDSTNMIVDLVKIRANAFQGKYKRKAKKKQ